MSPIKDFNVTYGTIDESDTFSEGDTIVGRVSFSLTKAIKVKSVSVKAKGDANVHWSEGSGDDERSYSDHRRYFKVKELLVAENAKGRFIYLELGNHVILPFHSSWQYTEFVMIIGFF